MEIRQLRYFVCVVERGSLGKAATSAIYALVRSQTPPFPGAFTYFEGKRLTVWRAKPVPDAPRYDGRIPGRVVGMSRADGTLDVLTGDGVMRLLEVQLDGGERTAAANVVRSVKSTLGLSKADLLRRIEQLEKQLASLRTEPRPDASREADWMPGGV
jgi:hypothetical protein